MTSATASGWSTSIRWPAAAHDVQPRARDAMREPAGVDHRHERILVAVQHERRLAEPVQPRLAPSTPVLA